ncbi:MAG: type II secretion system major pseudopilin GspG [Gammaproteobacteria bacterium]|nr:type II secretion system major pseudopilin GspG [Gammaproteobacteria bacterium]
MSTKTSKQSGFTLIEIMIVVVILGILASIVVPNIMESPNEARIVKAKQDIRTLEGALNLYKLDNFNYPSTDQGLEALVKKPSGQPEAKNWKKNGYMKKLPKDPWGNDYLYLNSSNGGDIRIFSYGADGRKGGVDSASDIDSLSL